ncbi:ABC transporter permease [Ferruginibacter yonginensis]|uniref:ABC transporter permease n=1 Tax=Ferruginibacter yonginensis TaxID=1310416 RepID=A0ABV8QT59_9BACT
MKKLLSIEWLKLKHYGAFKVLAIFFVVGVILTNYLVYIFNKNVIGKSEGAQMLSFSPYSFNNTWQTTSYATGFLIILPAMLLIIIITNEYTFKTNRQNIIDGWSRHEFISVKLVLALLFAVVSTILVILTALGFGFASGTSFGLNGVSHVGFFFLKALTYCLFAVLISVIIKKTGFAIGLYMIYVVLENFVSQMLDIGSIKLKKDTGADLGSVGDYLPLNASDGLLTFPENPLKTMAKSVLPTDYTWLVVAFAIFYIVLFVVWSRKKYTNADL